MNIDFALVVFGKEVPLLRLLARSFDIFGADVGRIYIMINDEDGSAVAQRLHAEIIPLFGRFAEHVTVIDGRDVPGNSSRRVGYQAQQALKLAVSGYIAGRTYVCIDAKNHFLASFDAGSWVSPDGRARMRRLQIAKPHQGYLRCSMMTFGIQDYDVGVPAAPTVTPYVMRTEVARRVVSHVEQKYKMPIFEYLETKEGRWRTEFFLYYAALSTSDRPLEELASFDGWGCPTLFGEWPAPGSAAAQARIKDAGNSKMFAVHRRRFATLTPEERQKISDLWVNRQLVRDATEAASLINEMASTD